MRTRPSTRRAVLLVVLFMMAWPASLAQIPPHKPGTVCATPTFWCWARHPGPPGSKCACYAAGTWHQGVLT